MMKKIKLEKHYYKIYSWIRGYIHKVICDGSLTNKHN